MQIKLIEIGILVMIWGLDSKRALSVYPPCTKGILIQ